MDSEQKPKSVSFFTRCLVALYVKIWIPIRLSYLRLKIKVKPYVQPTLATIAFSVIIILGVPISVLIAIGFMCKIIGHILLRLACWPFDVAVSQPHGTAYNNLTSTTLNDVLEMARLNDSYDDEDEIKPREEEEEKYEEEPDSLMDTMKFIDRLAEEIAKKEVSVDGVPEPHMIQIPNNIGFRPETTVQLIN